jgi:hypothetical protein
MPKVYMKQLWSTMVEYGQIWPDMARYGQICSYMFRHGQIWSYMVRYDFGMSFQYDTSFLLRNSLTLAPMFRKNLSLGCTASPKKSRLISADLL